METVAVIHHHVSGILINRHAILIDAFQFWATFFSKKRSFFGANIQHDVIDGAVDQHDDAVIFHNLLIDGAKAYATPCGNDTRRCRYELL